MPYVAIAMAIMAAISAAAQAKASSNQASFQAAVARQQAERQKQLAAIEEARVRADVSRKLASQRARMAAAGVQPSAGSALLIAESGAGEGEFQARLTRSQGLNRAAQLEQNATLSDMKGQAARTQGKLQVATSLLRAGGQASKLDWSTAAKTTKTVGG